MSDQRGASRTALATAYMRAAHQLLDRNPLILDDPLALRLLGEGSRQRIEENREKYEGREAISLRSHVVIRSRFAEDRLAAAVDRGVTQYVLLGAGFDTFAYRQPPWASLLRIIEIDHPQSQKAKKERLTSAGIEIPPNVEFADIDFEHETLGEGFKRHGVSMLEPTFFSWLGVTVYLTEEAVEGVFRELARFPIGSEVVFTFSQPRNPAALAKLAMKGPSLASMAAMAGEPWLTFYEPQALDMILRDVGFTDVYFLTPAESQRLYMDGRPADLPVPKRTSIGSATR